ncbi:MAG: excinuclease ABC subunit A [Bacteroidetes bacterium]|nr:MAG: excinuclease ABC subunit A [Bacteroidota bacterium]TAG95649.1 MAG: excinuclease ABC subunit A [Bacteroidota bacterium]
MQTEDLDALSPKENIIIKGAKVNNLKNISIAIPRNQFVVITGLSGSGKSSLAFDTLFAEGQRMYVESLSSYSRQFLGRMEKPDVESIKGISPAIAIEQKGNSKNPRATVGTTTEIYDYFKLFFTRIGKTFSPISNREVKKNTITEVVDFLLSKKNDTKAQILCPIVHQPERSFEDELKIIFQKGFTRIVVKNEVKFIEDLLNDVKNLPNPKEVKLLIDRISINQEEETQYRISDSVQTAFYEGNGFCEVDIIDDKTYFFSDKFELDGINFETPTASFFSFNNSLGACKTCNGLGTTTGLDEKLIIPNHSLSLFEDAVACWSTDKMSEWKKAFIKGTHHFDFPVHRAYQDLSEEEKDVLWDGNQFVRGINDFFRFVEGESDKIQYRVMLSRFKGKIICPDCRGTRLRKDAGYVKINKKSIIDLVLMPIDELLVFFEKLVLSEYEQKIAKRLLPEILNRVGYLNKVGLGYMSLNRLTSSLSGGEFQRIKLATALGSSLVGAMYILDEPSIGLHPRDTQKMAEVLKDLKNLGNTVIVVEHEEEVMRAADQIIDIGKNAGANGGNLVFQGNWKDIKKIKNKKDIENSYTIQFLTGLDTIPIPKRRRSFSSFISIKNATANNLKNVSVRIPLDIFTVVTGVSGSGKSTLIKKILYPAVAKSLGLYGTFQTEEFEKLEGDVKKLKSVEFIDQNPISRSTRSNPATYTGVYDYIRVLFSKTALSIQRDYDVSHFSFNSSRGGCETCGGEGKTRIEMQFMADVVLTCESCHGKRFKKEILEVTYNEKTIFDILEMTIEQALDFFSSQKNIVSILQPLCDVGLGYVCLGQSTDTISGGEAQRLKLAMFLKNQTQKTLFIFDEPTTGLHFHDIHTLLKAFQALVEKGHSVLVIEHNVEVIKCADWVIDLGPEGGKGGGNVCFTGTPEDLIKEKNNHTADFLKKKFVK